MPTLRWGAVVTRMPVPISAWTWRGFCSPDPPTRVDIEESVAAGRHRRLVGFVFKGEGWYPAWRVLVLRVGEDGWELYFYDHHTWSDSYTELVMLPVHL